MQILFLGSGSAFTVDDNFNSNMLVTAENGRNLLVDAGVDVRHALHARGLSYADIDDIYISHLHSDHVGGLEYIGLSTRFDPRCPRPRLFVAEQLAGPLWEHSLRGGMGQTADGDARLEDYFEVHRCGREFGWEDVQMEIVALPHVRNRESVMFSHGLRFEAGCETVFITTDTRFEGEYLAPHYEGASVIFHDCETGSVKSPVHTHYDDLCTLPAEVRAKMWLYHYQPGVLPDAVAAGFRGFVAPGQAFEFAWRRRARASNSTPRCRCV